MQKLIEEDYYKVFSYVFMVQHSLGFDNRSNKFSSLFSSQLIRKVEDLDTESLNGFLRSAVIFMDHIKLTNELWKVSQSTENCLRILMNGFKLLA